MTARGETGQGVAPSPRVVVLPPLALEDRGAPCSLLPVHARLLLLCGLLSAAPALADNTADESDLAFSLGNGHFARRQYEQALGQYFLSYRLVPNRNVLFNIARCYEALKRPDEAYRYYRDLSQDTRLRPDDARYVKDALRRLAPKVALLTISSQPPGAELFVDREDLGSRGLTPQTVAVPPGRHAIIVQKPGYERATLELTAVRGREVRDSVTLTPVVGTVSLDGSPVGATVRSSADGPALGALPATLTLAPGQHLLHVDAPGHLPAQVLVSVSPKQVTSARVKLEERPSPTGKVVVTANRENAIVRVAGKDSGFTPVVLTLPEGLHRIEVSSEDVAPFAQEVRVVADKELRISAELRYEPPRVRAAARSQLSLDDAPASVTIITAQELRAFGYQTLAEALTAVRGLFFTDDRIYTYVGIRGFSPPGDLNTRLLVLYDGHAVNDVWAGQGYAARDLDVDLGEVAHIEVVRGPASALFGTGAFFGVINVVPRERLSGKRNVEGTVGTGGAGGVKVRATGSLGQERRSLLLSAAAFSARGAETTDLGSAGVVSGMDGEQSLGASLRAVFDDFALDARFTQRNRDIPTAPAGSDFGVPGTLYADTRAYAELRWQRTFGRADLKARVAYDASRFLGRYATGTPETRRDLIDENGQADWATIDVRAGFRLTEGNTLSVAAEAQHQLSSQKPLDLATRDEHTRTFVSLSLVDEWRLGSRLFLQAGARADRYFDLEGFALSPRGALVAKPYQGGTTKAVAGQAFRAPSFYELYYSDGNITQRAPRRTATVDELPKPELITTFELEHAHDFTSELRVTVGGYFNLIDRLVVLEEESAAQPECGVGGPPQQCLVYANSAKSLRALGAEAQIRWQPGRFTLVDASYSFVTLAGTAAGDAPPFPAHLAAVRALVPLRQGDALLSGQLLWQSARRGASGESTGEALLLDFGLSGDLGRVRYFAGVRNLLDARYALPVISEAGVPLVPQYGRTFWLELTSGF